MDEAWVAKQYANGKSPVWLAEKTGKSARVIRHLLKRMGCKMRTRSESRKLAAVKGEGGHHKPHSEEAREKIRASVAESHARKGPLRTLSMLLLREDEQGVHGHRFEPGVKVDIYLPGRGVAIDVVVPPEDWGPALAASALKARDEKRARLAALGVRYFALDCTRTTPRHEVEGAFALLLTFLKSNEPVCEVRIGTEEAG